MKTDIQIAQEATMLDIRKIAEKIGATEDDIEMYGKSMAKLSDEFIGKLADKENGKLVLVTAINPTPAGEGKTTVTLGLGDAMRKLDVNSVVAIREPSLGPCFGIKGGAAGGGYAQAVPMDKLNLHFTGDFHAITSANNLLCAMLDNHLLQGNELRIDPKRVVIKRCLDMNDRALRNITVGLGKRLDGVVREDHFCITVATEVMAILCLAENLEDLKARLGKIIVAYNYDNEPVTAEQLKAVGAMTVLLKDAIRPNLIQSLENNPVFVHGGPFANIAHGCNSVVATKLALKLGDYVITEAGFGADLGAEKFLDIKCRKLPKAPDAVVCVATIKALKYHGGAQIDNIKEENMEALEKGIHNLQKHIENLKDKFGLNVIVAINKYITDTDKEIKFLEEKLNDLGIKMSLCEAWAHGGKGAKDLAQKIVELTNKPNEFKYLYDLSDSIEEKINKVAKEVYGAEGVEISDEAKEKIKVIEKNGYGNYPVCIAKTQYSLSDDAKNLLCDEPFKIHVRDVVLKTGAEFVVILTGNICTMPGLPKVPAAEKIDIADDGNIVGIF